MTAKYSTPPDEYAIPTEWRLGDDRDHIRERTWSLVLRGVDNPARYVELFEEELEAAHVSREAAVSFFESVIDLRRAQQEPWGETPTTQLTRAFSGLATIGVLAREDFTCCGGCAVAEIGGERDDSRTWRGYLYYHAQDTDQILERHTTYVGYGAFPDARFSRAEWSALTEEGAPPTPGSSPT